MIIGAIGANLTFGIISGVASAASGVYTVSSSIMQSTSSGAEEIKQAIKDSDLVNKIRTSYSIVHEIVITDKTPNTVKLCINSIRDVIEEISEELGQIRYRMQYNSNLWIGSAVRSYKFHNNIKRLNAKLKNLESRTHALGEVLKLQHIMYKNELLDTETDKLSDSICQVENKSDSNPKDSNPKDSKNKQNPQITKSELQKKLDFMK
jgi:hypothetical protein